MKRGALAALLAGVGLALAVLPISAHHSFGAEFDIDKPITVEGAIAEVKWENPHAWLFLDSKDASGRVTNWRFEMSTPTSLIRNGITRQLLKVGEQIKITGWHARDSSVNIGAAHDVALRDGRTFIVGPKGNEP